MSLVCRLGLSSLKRPASHGQDRSVRSWNATSSRTRICRLTGRNSRLKLTGNRSIPSLAPTVFAKSSTVISAWAGGHEDFPFLPFHFDLSSPLRYPVCRLFYLFSSFLFILP